METHQIKRIQHEAKRLLDLQILLKRIGRHEPIWFFIVDSHASTDVIIDYTNDNACYRAVESALKTYADELTHNLSRAVEVSQ